MIRGALQAAVLALSAAGALAAGDEVPERAVAPVQAADMRAGYGVVERVSEVRLAPAERSAAAGGSSASSEAGRPVYRIRVRMADGSRQFRDLDKREFEVGDNVLLTNAGEVLPDN
jgi:hypothetical protein